MPLPLSRRAALGGAAVLGATAPFALSALPSQALPLPAHHPDHDSKTAKKLLQRAAAAYRATGPRLAVRRSF